jgi:hypothetical protein
VGGPAAAALRWRFSSVIGVVGIGATVAPVTALA